MNRTMTVSQLSTYLRGVFDDEELLHDVTLSGEVTEVSYSEKHTYVVLAEGDISVRCAHFLSRDGIEKGAKVALKGSVRFFGKRSSVVFVYTEYFVSGEGDKAAKLAALKDRLYKLGYFENRPQLPKYIVNVVAVTSPDGAAVRDLIHVVGSKSPFVRVRVFPVKVQGDGAAAQIASAVKKLQSVKTDAIVLCRGGGSDEDLDTFNDERLATAVALSKIPVISAVGHEVDYTLCDFCAGTRAGTPSIAGEIINARAAALKDDLFSTICAGGDALKDKLEKRGNMLSALCTRLSAATRFIVARRKREVEIEVRRAMYRLTITACKREDELTELAKRLGVAAEDRLKTRIEEVRRLQRLLFALDPHRIFKAGYAAIVADGKSVSSASALTAGETVKMVFADGVATATVTAVEKGKTRE